VEENGQGYFEVLSLHLSEESKENHKNFRQDSQIPDKTRAQDLSNTKMKC
jgi:hypothetical protein